MGSTLCIDHCLQRPATLTQSDIRDTTLKAFDVRPCLWQIQVAEALLKGENDVICMAGTGMGKTLTFWIPLLFRSDGIQIIVTPLNLLGQQNVESLAKAGIRAIAISAETATASNLHVSSSSRRLYQSHLYTGRQLANFITAWLLLVPSNL